MIQYSYDETIETLTELLNEMAKEVQTSHKEIHRLLTVEHDLRDQIEELSKGKPRKTNQLF